MPEEIQEESFFDKLNKAKENQVVAPTFAEGNLTGITSANSRRVKDPGGYYTDLNEEVGINLFSNANEWEEAGKSSQSALDVITNTFYGGMTNMAAGFLEGVASNDLKGMYDISMGNTEARYGNTLHDWASSLMEASANNYHIYQGADTSPFSFEYWGQQLQSTGYSVGIIGEMFAEQALLAAVTRGSGNVASAATVGKRFSLLKKLPQLMAKQAVFGSYQGIKEAYMNGIQTGEEAYTKFKDLGFDDATAHEKANQAATLGFRMEVLPLMTMNALQFASLGKYNPFSKKAANLGFSGSFETLAETAFKGLKSPIAKKVADYGVNIVSEALEEGFQTAVSKEAQYQIGLANSAVGEKDIVDRWFDDDEMRDSMFGGGLGGGMFRFMGKRANKLMEGTKVKQQKLEYDEFMSNVATRINDDTADLKEAVDSGDRDKVDVIRKRMQRNSVMESLKLDLMNQKESSFEMYVTSLSEMIEAAESKDVAKMKEFGITTPDDVAHVTENFPTYIEDAVNMKEKLVENLTNTDDANAALQMTNVAKTLEELYEFEGRSQEAMNLFKATDTTYKQLTGAGKQKYDLLVESSAIRVKAEHGTGITTEQRERVEEIKNELIEWEENNKKYKGKAKDARLMDAINSEALLKEQVNIYEMQEHQASLTEKLTFLKDPKNQKQVRVSRAKRKIEKARNVEALKNAKETLKQEDTLTPEVEEKINVKIQKAEINEVAHPGKTNTPFGSVVAPTKEELQGTETPKAETNVGTAFGNVVTPKADELPPHTERTGKADEIVNLTNIKREGDAIVIGDEDLFEPAELGSYSPEVLEKLAELVEDYYTSLKEDLGKDPSFSEFIRDFIKNNTKDATDRIYNALVEGWRANAYAPADYDKVYNEIFRDRKEMSTDILNIAEELIAPLTRETEVANNTETMEKASIKKAPISSIDNITNQPVIVDTNPFRTSAPVLKAAHLSIPYQREMIQNEDGSQTVVDTDTSLGLNEATDVNSMKLLNPNEFGAGTALTVKIPDNFEEVTVATWEDDYTQGPSMKFGDWEKLPGNEQYTEGTSQQEIDKIEAERQAELDENSYRIVDKVEIHEVTSEEGNKEKYELRYHKDGKVIVRAIGEDGKYLGIINTFNSSLPLGKILGGLYDTEYPINLISTKTGKEAGKVKAENKINAKYDAKIKDLPQGKQLNPKWVAKVPMIAYDKTGEGVFFVHDTAWYNGINVGFKDDLAKQSEVISEARSNLMDIRNKIGSLGSVSIKITEKRPGTWKTINPGQPALTLNEANPHTQIGTADNHGNIIVGGKVFETDGKTFINTKNFESGHTYDIRQTGVNEYVALEVLRETVTPEVAMSVRKAVESYMYQYDEHGVNANPQKIKEVRDNVLAVSGIDIHSREGIESYIRQFIPTVQGKFSGVQDVFNKAESNSRIAVGTPYLTIQKGSLVFGVKGEALSEKNQGLYLNPRKIGDQGGPKMMADYLVKFNQLLEKATQHVDKNALTRNKKVSLINSDGEVTPGKNYTEFLKDSLKTSVKSFNVGTKDSPVYATIVQPVINFTEASNPVQKAVEEKKANPTVIKNTVDKIVDNKPMTKLESAISQVNAEEVKKKAKAEYLAKKVDEVQTLRDSLQALRELGVPENDPSLMFVLEQLGEGTDYEPIDINDDLVSKMRTEVSGTEGLSILQDFQITDYIFNEVTSKLDFKYKSAIGKEELLKNIKNSYFNLIEPKKIRTEATISNLQKLNEVNPNVRMTALIDKMKSEVEVFNVLKKNWKAIESKAMDKIYKYTGIQESKMDVKEVADASTEQEKNYSKSSLEENGKTTASYRLKRFLSGIKQVDASGKTKHGFLGVNTYVGFDTAYETLGKILSSPVETESSYETFILRFKENYKNYPWLEQIVADLENADQQIRNELVYELTKHTLSMKFVMFSKARDNSYALKVFDTNANEITRVIRNQWESNFKQSPLTFVEDGVYKINKAKAETLSAKFDEWQEAFKANPGTRKQASTVDIPTAELREWLADFGLSLSNETIEEFKTRPIEYMTNNGKETLSFPQMFRKSSNTAGIFGLLADYLETIVNTADTSFEENPNNHPFDNAGGSLKVLAKLESKYSVFATTNSFRDGDKSIYGFTPTKHTTDVVKDLKHNQEFRDQLSSKSFNKHSYMLQLLNENEAFREKFYVDHLGITSLKELGKKVFGDNSITALSDSDHELTKLGLFQDTEQGTITATLGKDDFVKLRMARTFMPTMSDKSQMLALNTAVLDLRNEHFVISEDNNVVMEKELQEIVYSQLVQPELDRLYNFVSTVKKTNIKGYDMAAKMFLMIPEMNNLVDEATGERAIALMAGAPDVYTKEWFTKTFKTKALALIQNMVATEVNNKMAEWEDAGFFETTEHGATTTAFLNQKYLDRFQGRPITQVKIAANDFVINSLLTNANSFMMIAGDIAMYSQNKIAKYFQDGAVTLPKEKFGNGAYAKAVKDVISVNVGKRLALMLAPGNKLANSKDAKYTQLFLNDTIKSSTNLSYLVNLLDGKTLRDADKEIIDAYNKYETMTENIPSEVKEAFEALGEKFPNSSEYFTLEVTDAQEYTTLSEHLNVLYGQGRLSSEEYKTMTEKVNAQLKAEKDGKTIPSSAMLNYNELKVVMQPIKPVHTGFKDENAFDAMRMMYIKSSAFPLIPQVTKGTELDKLRMMLENHEAVTGKPVRASYQTANKVGATTKAITPFNSDGTFNDKIGTQNLLEASLTLSRDNFRIQQDVPFKSGKRKEDIVSLGTQTLKLLFGDGVLGLNGFKYQGETLTGQELKHKFDTNFENYISHKKDQLYKQLGIDATGQPIDVESTMKNLQTLLKREAEERGYPKQDVEALRLSPVMSGDKVVDLQFSIPLWLSPNSNRYEALLNAIVSNKLVNIKIPGNSFVVGAQAGFKMQSDLSGVNQSRVIYSKSFDGDIRAAEFHENGKLKKAQIMIPSKFRDSQGNLIEFIDKKGKPNANFTEIDENGMIRIKDGAIASELMNITSFRIPTSGHVSMAQLEIVGILPTEVGDLMIVPGNLTKQKGLDFDVDKETTYQMHTIIDPETGGLRPLMEEDRQTILKEAEGTNLNDNTPEGRMIRAIFGEDPDFILEDLTEDKKLDAINAKVSQKLMENAFVEAHSSVLSNPAVDMQKKINKVLSMDFAQKQAELVQETTEQDTDNTHFTMLSDSFQKSKMFLGASGKLGIGVYSNYVVFHSMAQQNPGMALTTFDADGNIIPKHFQIGNQLSTGTLGLQTTLAKGKLSRNIAEVFAERQNTATDNEKEQIMGRLNVNEVTINVDSLMSALGFDKDVLKDGTEVSIPYLFLSQPVIKELVKEIRKTKSNTVEYDSMAEAKVIKALKEKYAVENEYDAHIAQTLLTGENLFNNLKPGGTRNMIQLAVLETFLDLKETAKSITGLQGRLNINKEGLGKSFFETIDKYNAVDNIASNYGSKINGASGLVGNYISKEGLLPTQIEDYVSKGYVEFEKNLIKPNNPIGSMLVHSTKTGYDLWKDFFPYSDAYVAEATSEILEEISNESTSDQKRIQLQQEIFKDLKRYVVSSNKLGTFTGNPQVKRKELFIDTETNRSLAGYLRDLVYSDDKTLDFLRGNKLLSRFQYDVKKNGLPSVIKFDNSKGENFDEDYLYMSLIELLDQNRTLPTRNGQSYSTRELAKDLVAYNYLEGGVQEAVQFSKYIPVSFLNAIPFGESARKWSNSVTPGVFGKILGNSTGVDVSRFTRQYIQHNPQRLNKIDVKEETVNPKYKGKAGVSSLTSFELSGNMTEERYAELQGSKFISIYDKSVKKGMKKFQVFENIEGTFHKISTLGVFGMSEYDIRSNDVNTIVNQKAEKKVPAKKLNTEKPESNPDIFGIQSESVEEIVSRIADYKFIENPHLAPIAKTIKDYVGGNMEIKVADIVNSRGDRFARGSIDSNNNITIDSHYFKTASNENIAKTVVHEVIHGLTSNYLSTYVTNDGKYKTGNPPQEVVQMVMLFNEAKGQLGAEIDAYKAKRDAQLAGLTREATTERERTVAYAGTNIKEFVTLVMTEPNFQEEMRNVTYQNTNQSLYDRFVGIVNNLLVNIFGADFALNGITFQGIQASLNLIEAQAKQKEMTAKQKMEDNDAKIESALASPFGGIIIPTDSELENFDKPDKNDNFEDPFKCK